MSRTRNWVIVSQSDPRFKVRMANVDRAAAEVGLNDLQKERLLEKLSLQPEKRRLLRRKSG